MGRQVKRVPVDFDWPIDQVWEGYTNPFYEQKVICTSCDGVGYSPEAKRLYDQWYGTVDFDPKSIGAEPLQIDNSALRQHCEDKIRFSIQRCAGDRRYEYYTQGGRISYEAAVEKEIQRMFDLWSRQWSVQLCQDDADALVKSGKLNELQSQYPDGHKLTAAEVNDLLMLSPGYEGYGILFVCIKARAKRENIEELYCRTCAGDGLMWLSKEVEKNALEWKPTEPPNGNAYQIWEHVTAGSPVSPPFLNPEDLAHWMVENDSRITRDVDYDGWLKFILAEGQSISAAPLNGELVSGVRYFVESHLGNSIQGDSDGKA